MTKMFTLIVMISMISLLVVDVGAQKGMCRCIDIVIFYWKWCGVLIYGPDGHHWSRRAMYTMTLHCSI